MEISQNSASKVYCLFARNFVLIYKDCYMPKTMQTWFQITGLHVWMSMVRMRAFHAIKSRNLEQHLVDEFFDDCRFRLNERLNVRKSLYTI